MYEGFTGYNQKWNSVRPKFNPLLYDFHIFLADTELRRIKERTVQQRTARYHKIAGNRNINCDTILWIETLLQTPIADHRKYVIFRILPRYLINKKQLSYNEAFNVIKDWLGKCNSVSKLDSNFNSRIKDSINYAIKSGRVPISLSTLKLDKNELYEIIMGELE